MTPFCAAVDWGTSSFRLWVLGADGTVLDERRSAEGMMDAAKSGFAGILEGHLAALAVDAALPVIVCGMAGARQGWKEAGYVDTPADLAALAAHAVRVDCSRDVRILPGVAQRDAARPDVMRGEETQIAGLLESGLADRVVCLPGTHSKWARVEDGRIVSFSTFMTGEMFALLRNHSILRHDTSIPDTAGDAAFSEAVAEALATPERILNLAFSVRSGSLLGLARPDSGFSRLSGLLIGLEIAGARHLASDTDTVMLATSGALSEPYRKALETAGLKAQCMDADDATRRGLLKAACSIWGERGRQ